MAAATASPNNYSIFSSQQAPPQQHHHRRCCRVGRLREMFASILLCPIFVILHFTINDCIITCDAVLASPFPFTLSLPDGTMSDNITIVGSPAFFLTQDERGYTVLVDSKDKFVKYAVVDAATGQIKPSNMKMSKDANPEKLGITKGVQPTEEAKKINCGEYCEDEVAVHEYVKPRRSCNRFCSITGGISRRLRNWNPGLADWMLPKSWIEQDVSDVDDETAAEERLHRRQRRRNLSIVGGKLVNLVIPIRFADHASRPMIPKEDIDILFNAVNGHKELAPTGSIRDVFAWSSYGKMIVESTVVDWITLSNTESFYAGGKSGITEAFSAGLKEALDHLENDPTFDFATFDRNGDRKIDAITFLHSGYGAEWGAVDCSSGNDSKERIWSHKWKLKPQEWTSQKSGVTVSEYHVSPSFFGTCGSDIFRIGTLAHEMGRFIGLPDIYGGGPPHGGYGIGSFGLMSNSWGFDGSQMNPPVLSAWGKMEMGWLSPDIISASGHYELPPIHGSPKAYKIFLGSADEFLLIENRPATSFTPKSGLLIFHIDNEASHRPEGVVGPKGSHYRVSLVQADGKHELELGVNRGDEGDIFVAGNTLGIGFTGEGDPTYPNTDSYRGGALTPTGISIASITDPDENGYVRFSVTFPGEQLPDLTPPTPSPTSQPKLELVRTELMTTFAGGTGSFGVMFDAVAIKGLTITSADLHLSVGEDDGEKAIEIYTAVGTHLGIEKSPEKWTKVCCAKKVLGNGLMKRTSTSSLWLQQVNMSPGERRGWYITSDEPIVRYSRSEKSDCCEVFTNSAHLQIEEGQGVGGFPWGNTLKRRIWNGVFHYETMDVVKSDANSGYSLVSAGSLWYDPDRVKVASSEHFSGNSGSVGFMFDVIPRKKMTIVGLDFHTESTDVLEVEVWYKRGSHVGFERDQMSWAEISYAHVVGQGPFKRTSIDPSVFNAVLVDAFERISFYVTLFTSAKMRYTKIEDTRAVVGDIASSLEEMDIMVGSGVGSYPFGYAFSPRFPNNSILYVLVDEVEDASKPAPTPTLPPDVYVISDKKEISTTFSSGNGGHGVMFDVECKSETGDLIISSLDFHTDLVGVDINVKVFTKRGSYVGFGYRSEAWEIVADTTVKGEGYYKRTVINPESFKDVVILHGCVQAFYVTIDKPNLRYSNAENVGDVWVSEENEIVIKVGAGLGGGLASFSSLFEPRVMNGVIHYHMRNQQTFPPTSADPILASPTSISGSLKTDQEYEAGSYGVIFSVRNKGLSAMHITGLSIYSDFFGDFGVEVYALEGGFLGESVIVKSQITSTTISGTGSEFLVQIPMQKKVEVKAGQLQSLYVTLDRPSLQYSMGEEGTISASDDFIEILDGSGVLGYPLSSSNVRSGRRFVGVVDYIAQEGAIALVIPTTQPTVSGQFLSTLFEGNSGSYGVLFDVTNVRQSQKVIITKLDIHASGEDSLRCEVWYRRGSSLDYPWNTDGGGWIMVVNESLVPEGGSGESKLIRFSKEKFTPIEIDSSELVGLLVQCDEERVRYSIHDSSGPDKIVSMNDSIMIESGYGVTVYPLSARVQFDRAFEGVIRYSDVSM